MKNTRKIFSVLLAIVLVFAMTIPAFAEETTGTITISKPIAGQTYTAYQMLTFTPAAGATDAGIYKVAAGWETFFATDGDGADYFNVDETDGTVTLIDKDNADLAALAKAAVAYAKDTNNNVAVAATATPTAGENGEVADVVFSGLALGYYAIDTTLGTVCALTNTNSDETLFEKNFVPTIDKVVEEDSSSSWGKVNDAEIGDTVKFKTTVTVKPGATKYVVHDKMEAGLTFNDDIKIEGLEKGEDKDYTVSTSCDDNCTFEITFTETYLSSVKADTDVVITYSAVLNNNAEIVTETNDNTTWLTYGDNATQTEESTTQTLTYYFNLTKTDKEGNQLDGAEFTLSNADGVMKFVEIEGGYRVATAEDTNTTETIVAGAVVIKGLDADTYILTETKAPAGYNLLDDPISVTVNKATVDTTIEFEAVDEKVENLTGGLLPETGGIGTTIFYIVGALLVVGAVILLITKKRMSAEA